MDERALLSLLFSLSFLSLSQPIAVLIFVVVVVAVAAGCCAAVVVFFDSTLTHTYPHIIHTHTHTHKRKNNKTHIEMNQIVFIIYQLLTMDILAFATMKNAANCDT